MNDGPDSHRSTDSDMQLRADDPDTNVGEAPQDEAVIPLWNYPATYTLIAINLIVYAVMFRFGPVPELIHQHAWTSVLTAPFDWDTLRKFGGSETQLVLQGQWWRLITSNFVHVTVLHIAINLWCLWNLGLFGEPLLGKQGLIAVYVLTGVSGMLLSLSLSLFHWEDGLVAGASGAVFGLAGILIVLLSNRGLKAPWDELRALRRMVIFFSAVNLVSGLIPNLLNSAPAGLLQYLHLKAESIPRIDNMAHLGGFLSGILLGLALFPALTQGRPRYLQRQRITFGLASLLLCLVAYALLSAYKAKLHG